MCFVSTDGAILYLSFYYLMNLNIMTVKTKVSIPTDLNTTISAGCVFVCVFVWLCLCGMCVIAFSFSGICWNLTRCSAVCTPVTTEEKPPTRLITTSLTKSGEVIKDSFHLKSKHQQFIYLRFYSTILPFSSIVCFSDYVEDLGHPYMWVQSLGGLQFPRAASEVCV